jgi:hypothetical protein
MSNHWHGVVTDPFARLPEFLERFHRLLARAQNASLGRWENLWSSDKPSVIALGSDEDVLEKMAYTIANPTAAGLVRSPREWPGVVSLRITERASVNKPDVFFDPRGPLPERAALHIVRPPIYPHLDDAALSAHLARAVERRVREARASLAEQGRKFQGARAVLGQPFDAAPHSPEPRRNQARASPQSARSSVSKQFKTSSTFAAATAPRGQPGGPDSATPCFQLAPTRFASTLVSLAPPPVQYSVARSSELALTIRSILDLSEWARTG